METAGRRIAVLIPAVSGGVAAVISFRYTYRLPQGPAAVAAGWAVVVLCFDCFDLSLMIPVPDCRLAARAVAAAEIQAICETQDVSQFGGCRHGTCLAGPVPVCSVRLGKDQAAFARGLAQATQATARPSPQIAFDQTGLPQAEQQEQADHATAQAKYGQDDGLIMRSLALGEFEHAVQGVQTVPIRTAYPPGR